MPRQRANPKTLPDVATFRLKDEDMRLLVDRAQAMGISHHELARSYTLERLHDGEERAALRESVSNLQVQLEQLTEIHKDGVEVLLSYAGKLSREKAEEWTNENF